MKYTREERLEIGRRIYDGELTKYQASEKYGIGVSCARDYMRLYRDVNNLQPRYRGKKGVPKVTEVRTPETLDDINAMSREELIDALVMARINEARLKKGYMVKGDGPNKHFIVPDKKNIK